MSPIQNVCITGGASAPPVVTLSKVFPGKVCCNMCGLPVPPDAVKDKERGRCVVCADTVEQVAAAIMSSERSVVVTKAPPHFDQVIKTLRESTGPATVGTAEAILQELGGEGELGKRIAVDLKRARLEHLSPEVKQFHEPDLKLVRQMYELVTNILEKRDERLKGSDIDPMGDMDEESLMALITESTLIRLEADAKFREDILMRCYTIDKEEFELVRTHMLTGKITPLKSHRDQPTVIVLDPDDEH